LVALLLARTPCGARALFTSDAGVGGAAAGEALAGRERVLALANEHIGGRQVHDVHDAVLVRHGLVAGQRCEPAPVAGASVDARAVERGVVVERRDDLLVLRQLEVDTVHLAAGVRLDDGLAAARAVDRALVGVVLRGGAGVSVAQREGEARVDAGAAALAALGVGRVGEGEGRDDRDDDAESALAH
jgi:hypothetical protein